MRVGFIGLGAMGNPMAANLQKAGHELTIHDIRREQGPKPRGFRRDLGNEP